MDLHVKQCDVYGMKVQECPLRADNDHETAAASLLPGICLKQLLDCLCPCCVQAAHQADASSSWGWAQAAEHILVKSEGLHR